MIDYLAELLAEEEEEAILLGRQVTVRKHRVIPAEEDGERGEQPGKHNARLEDGTERMEPLEEQEETLVNGVRALEGPMEKAADWIETARKNGNAGEQLYAALHRAARGASAAQGGGASGVAVTLPGEWSKSEHVGLAELDKAVERDARRYDGGFPLY